MTQKELSERLGTSQQNLAQYENGKRNPKTQTLIKIAKALNIPVSELAEPMTIAYDYHIFENSDSNTEQWIEITGSTNPQHTKILDYFNALNVVGQKKALKQMELLSEMPEYQKNNK